MYNFNIGAILVVVFVSFEYGSGLQCFECNVENDHICSKTGVQNGRIIDCSKDETACSKSVGEALGVETFSGGCTTSNVEGCRVIELPMIYAKATQCVCRTTLCNGSNQIFPLSHICIISVIIIMFCRMRMIT